MQLRNTNAILIAIVVAQFLCTSLWFATNGVLEELITAFALPSSALGHLTTAIQGGFICGTFVFALLRIADKYSPSRVFLISAIIGAIANACVILPSNGLISLLALRFITGFFLAGVYPVGMKIASDYFEHGLGKALGWLVGALVLGTALPHGIRYIGSAMNWDQVLLWISGLAALGGIVIGLFVKDGPYRQPSRGMDVNAITRIFHIAAFRKPAFGYFGHMWELYAFWAFVPVLLSYYAQLHPDVSIDVALWSFLIIGSGGVACIQNGYVSLKIGAFKAALYALMISGVCCLISPLIIIQLPVLVFLLIMVVWGMTVVADSPMFSALVAKEAPAELRGTGLTIVVCIGFGITIVSIQLLNWLQSVIPMQYLFLLLAPGPILGTIAMLNRGIKASA